MSKTMQYPLQEKIGHPDLLVGREKEFENFGQWIASIPHKISKSRVILARRKSGKTAFIQRLFNQLWTANGAVIPFYFDVAESKVWYPDFAVQYYRAFASQYIAFLERDPVLVAKRLSLNKIKDYGLASGIDMLVDDIDVIIQNKAAGLHDSVWETAYSAPHRFADVYDQRVLVIIDEFQNITHYVYRDEACAGEPDETLAGSFHYHVESKIAPMLVTGSYIRWMINISSKYLEAGRLTEIFISPYLTPESGLEAVYRYASAAGIAITNAAAVQINSLCMSDPFFISCVIQSNYAEKDLTTVDGVVSTVNYEVTHRYSEMSRTWNEYIQLTLQKINDRHAKKLLLFLSRHSDRYWTPKELQTTMGLELEVRDIQRRLMALVEADLLEWGTADIDFRGLQDGTLNLILRSRFEKEIHHYEPDLKQEFHQQIQKLTAEKKRIQGQLNQLSGQVAEMQLASAIRSRKRFRLSRFFEGAGSNVQLNIVEVYTRWPLLRKNGKSLELDLLAHAADGQVLVVEVKKRQVKTGRPVIEDFLEKVAAYQQHNPDRVVIPAVLSLGGFTAEALALCGQQGIQTAEKMAIF